MVSLGPLRKHGYMYLQQLDILPHDMQGLSDIGYF